MAQAYKTKQRAAIEAFLKEQAGKHLTADEKQQPECYVRDKGLDGIKIGGRRMYAKPTDHRHSELEKGEHTGKQTDAALAHRGLVQAVCKRHGKGVHGKPCTKSCCCEKKLCIDHNLPLTRDTASACALAVRNRCFFTYARDA